jgi:hypothetical protein
MDIPRRVFELRRLRLFLRVRVLLSVLGEVCEPALEEPLFRPWLG